MQLSNGSFSLKIKDNFSFILIITIQVHMNFRHNLNDFLSKLADPECCCHKYKIKKMGWVTLYRLGV